MSLRLKFGNSRFEQNAPLAIEVIEQDGLNHWLVSDYREAKVVSGSVLCKGEVVSPGGTHFKFQDLYRADAQGFQLTRRVEVSSASPQDIGFSSRFGLEWAAPLKVRDGEAFMPGVWYRDNKSIPHQAFPSNLNDQVLMLREDRLGLPLVSFREPKSGVALTLERVGGTASTITGDNGRQHLSDSRLQTGALGFLNTGQLQQAFTFPGTEDERSAINSSPGPRYLPRSHPVREGAVQKYSLHFEVRKTADFAELLEATMKSGIDLAAPPLLRADLPKAYRASQDLLNAVIQPHNGTFGVPFQVSLPHGEIKDTSTQMGFVGMALPCAALLLESGLRNHDDDAVSRAEQVIEFWVTQSATSSGIPKSWADFPSPGKVTWRPYPTHLRVASDGMEGVLQAWSIARRFHHDRPTWLNFARNYGDFLVAKQNADGSWFGSWDLDGTPRDQFTNATTHPIEFLIDLSVATGDVRYRNSALRAGDFCWKTVHQTYSYVGGTPDNPNVTDKEAGMMAVRAFLALHDASEEKRWMEAAKQAALFCESWVYWRDLPVPEGDDQQVFPRGRSTVGLSLIATGHSGADNYMAMAPFWWYRIYLATGDTHFLRTARVLLHDTKQVMDYEGKAGYKYRGLMPEAMDLTTNRGRGVSGWLPWLTFVTMDPMRHLREAFGSMDVDEIERLSVIKRRELSSAFAKTRGF